MASFNNRKKRTKEELIASILDGAKNGATKTKIMYSAYLSYDQLLKYMDYALQCELIILNGDNIYSITAKGKVFLKNFQELQKMESNVVQKREILESLLEKGGKSIEV